MALAELDKQYLQRFNFDSSDNFERAWTESIVINFREMHTLIDGYVEGHPGEWFSPGIVARETAIAESTCMRLLNSHPLVVKDPDRAKQQRYLSVAQPLIPSVSEDTIPAPIDKDQLGKQAREDWWRLIYLRRQNVKKRHKVLRHF